MTNKVIKLDITSDSVCPFCYGFRKIEQAIEKVKADSPDVDFSIQFHPFLLDPNASKSPKNKRGVYIEKFGSAERVDGMIKMMKDKGKECGINFSYGGDISQTTSSHRLISKAYLKNGQDMQLDLINRIFKGYFENEKNVGDHAWLAQEAVASKVFETTEEALRFLESDELLKEVQQEVLKSSTMGISGVPFTVIDNKYAVSGAQEPAVFTEIFSKVARGMPVA
ncbi:Thioredoxin-like fold [Phaffia rhodozyma]|uniref:Thioredoxin-like fold n=1 Tax=Phaffia rhodozyma TaxID=264483 RepID=A0A0F7SJI7_PHARH|nr:Thioredoxin-like fold [Phaffia rhodozyma]